MKIPIISDLTRQISRDYGVLLEDEGHTLRGLFIIDDRGNTYFVANFGSENLINMRTRIVGGQ